MTCGNSDDPRLREEVLDRFWSSVALHSVYAARGLSGDALDALPLAARGHLRAALALRVVTSAEDDLSITDAQRLVSTVLDRRIDGDGVAVSGLPLPEVIDLWPFDGHGESHIAAASYLGRSRRTVANDPETDLTPSVLRPRRVRTRRGWPCCSRSRSTRTSGSGGRQLGWSSSLGREGLGPNLILHLEGPARRTEVRDRIQ